MSIMTLTFECVSALSTVGSSLNATPLLCDESKLLVSLLMFIGRVGFITLVLGIVKQKKNTKYRYPSDNIIPTPLSSWVNSSKNSSSGRGRRAMR